MGNKVRKATDIKSVEDFAMYEGAYMIEERIYNANFVKDEFYGYRTQYDWHDFVDDKYKDVWSELPNDVKLCIYLMANAAEVHSDKGW